jgi:hypothetical protein
MRGLFGLVGLVVVLAVVGLLAKSQLSAVRAPAVEMPGVTAGPASAPAGNVREQSRQMQDQVRQQMEGLMQQARPMPEGEK